MEFVVNTLGVAGWMISLVTFALSLRAIILFPHYSRVVVLAITTILGTLGVLGSIFRAKCTEYLKWNLSKDRVTVIGGTFLILACTVHLTFVFLVALDVNSKS